LSYNPRAAQAANAARNAAHEPPAHFFREDKAGLVLFVRLTPKAGKNAVAGLFAQADGRHYLNIQLRAVPAKGEANQALIRFLSKSLNMAAQDIQLTRGHTARFKQLMLRGDIIKLRAKLAALTA